MSKNTRKNKKKQTRVNKYQGGNTNLGLAFPSNNIFSLPNPALAYTGKGGNISNAYPSLGPSPSGFNFINPQINQHGGCGCSMLSGGSKKSKQKCSICKMKLWGGTKVGGTKVGGTGNNGIPYPNGLVGSPWSPSVADWPGVNNIPGDHNYLSQNTYPTDIQTSIIDSNSMFRFKGGKTRKGCKREKGDKTRKGGKREKGGKTKKGGKHHLRGGTMSNFLGEDLVNMGRQFQFGLGSAYNSLAGYNAPVNPLPWKDQLTNTSTLSSLKASSI
jgi:hypothetical protein